MATRTSAVSKASGHLRAELRVDARPVGDHASLQLVADLVGRMADDVRREVIAVSAGMKKPASTRPALTGW